MFLNSVDRGLRLIRDAGVDAAAERAETEDSILLTIRIPNQRRQPPAKEACGRSLPRLLRYCNPFFQIVVLKCVFNSIGCNYTACPHRFRNNRRASWNRLQTKPRRRRG